MTPTPANKTRLLGIAMLVLTFVVGALSGAALDRLLVAEPVPAPAVVTPAPTPASDEEPERRSRRGRPSERDIFDQLDLTVEQREKIDEILDRRRAQLDAFWAETRPKVHSLVESTRADIRAILTPEQRAEYDRLRAEARREREEHNAKERSDR